MENTAPMDETTYHNLCDDLYAEVEQILDDADTDYYRSGGVLEIETDNGDKIIITRQPPLREIWLAEKTAGRHFRYQNNEWQDTQTATPLLPHLKSLLT